MFFIELAGVLIAIVQENISSIYQNWFTNFEVECSQVLAVGS